MKNLLLIVLVGLTSITALGADFESPRTAALGGAGHAGPFLDDSIYMNPSYTSMIPTESGSVNYFFFKGPTTPAQPGGTASDDPHGHGFNVSLQDGTSEFFQAGVGFTQNNDSREVNVGASRAIIKQLGVGIGGKFIFDQTNNNPNIQDGIFSVTGIISKSIQSAFIIDNLAQTQAGLNRNLYRELILGTKFNVSGLLLLYLDPHIAPSYQYKYGHELGAELTLFSDFFLRAGTFLNSYIPAEVARGNGFGGGIGWIGPKFSIDYALQRVMIPQQCSVQNIGMTFYL
jgi:hypothetical protein